MDKKKRYLTISNFFKQITLEHQKNYFLETLIFAIYIAITAFTMFYHEPWRDAAQAWLITKDLPLLSIFKQASYEGHPVLWNMILFPFAKLGFPYPTIKVIHLAIAYFIATIWLYKSPFSFITKVVFLFSIYMAYEYTVVARNNNICILLLFLIAILYQDRWKKPLQYTLLIFLLYQSRVYSCFTALALSIVFFFEYCKQKQYTLINSLAVVITIMGALAVFWQLYPQTDHFISERVGVNFFLRIIDSKMSFSNFFDLLANGFFTIGQFLPFKQYRFLFAIFYLLFLWYLWQTSKKLFFILFFSHLGIAFVLIDVYGGRSYRLTGFFVLTTVFILWLALTTKKIKIKSKRININFGNYFIIFHRLVLWFVTLSLASSIPLSGGVIFRDYQRKYSNSKEMATYIKDNFLYKNTIVAHRSPHASALLGYLPGTKFWYADVEQYATFVTWNKKYRRYTSMPFSKVVEKVKQNSLFSHQTLFLLTKPIPKKFILDYQLLYKVDQAITNENYYLYKLRNEK